MVSKMHAMGYHRIRKPFLLFTPGVRTPFQEDRRSAMHSVGSGSAAWVDQRYVCGNRVEQRFFETILSPSPSSPVDFTQTIPNYF